MKDPKYFKRLMTDEEIENIINPKLESLIPTGGTFNWMINCERNNYNGGGYTHNVVCEIPISFDCRITVEDHSQRIYISYGKEEYEKFFTSVIFYKKELDNHSVYAPHVYERAYPVYFPYGTRFDENMLLQIGTALNNLIDRARDLSNCCKPKIIKFPIVKLELKRIRMVQKQLLDLFITGTNNPNAVSEILKRIELYRIKSPKKTEKVREARYNTDFLPYFTGPLFHEFKELEEYKKNSKNDNELTM